jgi:hypothetical protein
MFMTEVFGEVGMKPEFWLYSKKGKAVPLHAIEAFGGGGEVYLLLILDFGTRWG